MRWPRRWPPKGTELSARQRADELLVCRGLAGSVEEAKRLIMAGCVHTEGRRIDKAGNLLAADIGLTVRDGSPYVSRGGLKLAHALEAFSTEVSGVTAVDVGASTGGFTDCLLKAGARRVYAVDVGYGQLAWELRQDERVVVMERTNIRSLGPADLDPRPELAVVDLAFVSLTTVLAKVLSLLAGPRRAIALIKPQFEVDRACLDGGVVRQEADRERAVNAVLAEARRLGFAHRGPLVSPITGADGNIEYLVELVPEGKAAGEILTSPDPTPKLLKFQGKDDG